MVLNNRLGGKLPDSDPRPPQVAEDRLPEVALSLAFLLHHRLTTFVAHSTQQQIKLPTQAQNASRRRQQYVVEKIYLPPGTRWYLGIIQYVHTKLWCRDVRLPLCAQYWKI